ncbi:unnamed protein product (macronuclear) [Paramecium tetraurelia]|uniref:Protein kinase domain-containing protein n=1 Tax=Paramecium tetraurelia TaxID=5888 RepID=A0CGM8_PARTE|nr:uncharacterized protein GSPATT00007385001 [Paramecium tetraurelia]CAK69945.1 unnamed protein product [Paramecium tetraurelia]|eukprot:XP_001437342.1 hypothetical protein (macronuclear) [Paramecium tetraurelia strain d4-2]
MHIKTTLLSEGSSSYVFLTEDPNYVMKVFKSIHPVQARIQEAQILEDLKSDHVVKLITFTDDYLILERLRPQDLFEVVKSQNLNHQLIKETCKTLIRIINDIHKMQVVHRDIKLENILIDNTGKLVLCDFGFAEQLSSCSVNRTVGTLNYMAPELHQESLLGGKNSEKINTQILIKSDVFSLGVSIFQIILGFQPFTSTKPGANCKLWRLIQQKKWTQYWTLIQKLSKLQIEPITQNFLESFLQSDTSSRTTLDEIYTHPFLNQVQDDVHLIF